MRKFTCPHFRKVLKTNTAIAAGKKVKCPGCRQVFPVTGFVWPGFLLGTSAKDKVGSALTAPAQRRATGKSGSPEIVARGAATNGSRSIREIMVKLTKGPQSLGNRIGQELLNDPPAWEALQAHTTEYAALAGSMASHDPPKGSKESWAKLTAAFADSAAVLDQAVQGKNKDAALAARKGLENACMACHQQHRGGPGGFGPGRPGNFGAKGGFGAKDGKGPKKNFPES